MRFPVICDLNNKKDACFDMHSFLFISGLTSYGKIDGFITIIGIDI